MELIGSASAALLFLITVFGSWTNLCGVSTLQRENPSLRELATQRDAACPFPNVGVRTSQLTYTNQGAHIGRAGSGVDMVALLKDQFTALNPVVYAAFVLLTCAIVPGFSQTVDKSRSNATDPALSSSLEKIKRYLAYDMTDEALEETKRAIAGDEFNAELRLIYGEILCRKRRYEEAIKQLQICRKLNPDLWQASEWMADAYLMTWNQKKTIADRVAASELYESLLSLQPRRESSGQETIISAKKRIEAKAAQLESPIGT